MAKKKAEGKGRLDSKGRKAAGKKGRLDSKGRKSRKK